MDEQESVEQRVCPCCTVSKSAKDFQKHPSKNGNLSTYCILCIREKQQARRDGSEARKISERREMRYKEYERISQEYQKHSGLAATAVALNITEAKVTWALKKTATKVKGPYKYKVDHMYFSSIDCPEKAYWLGFILADGSVSATTNALRVGLAKKDIGHLEKLRTDMGSNHPIRIERPRRFPKACFLVHSKQIKNDLGSLGIHPRKSTRENLQGLTRIPKDFVKDFWRGVVDGDGSIMASSKPFGTAYSVSLCGSHEVCTGFQEWSQTLAPHTSKVRKVKDANLHVIHVHGSAAVKAIEEMYYSGCTSLDRKRLRAEAAIRGDSVASFQEEGGNWGRMALNCQESLGSFTHGTCWCGQLLPRKKDGTINSRRRWCNTTCQNKFAVQHYWPMARKSALKRDKYTCQQCGATGGDTKLQVHHIVPVLGQGYKASCLHHATNLVTCCVTCHQEITKAQIQERKKK